MMRAYVLSYERERDSHRTSMSILSPSPSIDPFNMHSSFLSSLTHFVCVFCSSSSHIVNKNSFHCGSRGKNSTIENVCLYIVVFHIEMNL